MGDFVDLSLNMVAAKNDRHPDPFAWIFDLRRDSSNVSRYTEDNAEVSFGGNTYTPKEIRFEPPGQDMDQSLPEFRIKIGNANKTELAYWRAGKYARQEVACRLVNLAYTSNSADRRLIRGTIKRAMWDDTWVTFICGMRDLRKAPVPREKLYATRCRHKFKSVIGCGYSGAATACDLLETTCDGLGNKARWGGCSSLPRERQ